MSDFKPHYVFDGQPEPGQSVQVRPGIFWLRMPLPFKLDHINLWIVDDGDNWTVIDTGFATDLTKQLWHQVLENLPENKPVGRVIVTHFHPDHIGLAGWFEEQFDAGLWMSHGEWAMGRMLSLDHPENLQKPFYSFYKNAGFDDEKLQLLAGRQGRYAKSVTPIPASFTRLIMGETLEIGSRRWKILPGTGHAPEHACLYSADDHIFISGDQVLPRISPNVSVWPQEPDSNPLHLFLESLKSYHHLDSKTLVLPSHDWPFDNLHGRLDDLREHHDDRLTETLAALGEAKTAMQVMDVLFTRKLDDHQLFFAIGETIAHLHYLEKSGKIISHQQDGVTCFSRL